MSKIIKKADVYLKGETTELRVTVDISDTIIYTDIFVYITRETEKYLNEFKLISIYFREEEESHD